jgi:hypothetical protein
VSAVLFTIAAGCWPTGFYLLTTSWQHGRRILGDRLEHPTPLADEVERWLRSQVRE